MRANAFFKTLLSLSFFFAMTISVFASPPVNTFEEEFPPRWEKLGSRKVKFDVDKDVITVTRWDGRFNAVRLKVEKSDINLYRFVIHYGNGTKQEYRVNKMIRAGNFTRLIDLRGNRRVINRVEFFYETKGYEGRKATVELWGRK